MSTRAARASCKLMHFLVLTAYALNTFASLVIALSAIVREGEKAENQFPQGETAENLFLSFSQKIFFLSNYKRARSRVINIFFTL